MTQDEHSLRRIASFQNIVTHNVNHSCKLILHIVMGLVLRSSAQFRLVCQLLIRHTYSYGVVLSSAYYVYFFYLVFRSPTKPAQHLPASPSPSPARSSVVRRPLQPYFPSLFDLTVSLSAPLRPPKLYPTISHPVHFCQASTPPMDKVQILT